MEKELIEKAHKHTFANAKEVLRSQNCGCCYCERIYPASDIQQEDIMWEPGAKDNTVLCPYCGIEAVFGDASGITPTPDLLARMYRHFF